MSESKLVLKTQTGYVKVLADGSGASVVASAFDASHFADSLEGRDEALTHRAEGAGWLLCRISLSVAPVVGPSNREALASACSVSPQNS